MDEALMIRWVKEILVPYTEKDRCPLLLDSFAGHKKEAVKKAMRKANVVPAVIPGGCTSKLQPLDVSVNKPFKAELYKSCETFMKEESAKVVWTGERIKAASKEEIVRWLASATDYIKGKPDLVRRSLKACMWPGRQPHPN